MDYSVQVTPSTHDSVMRAVGYIADVCAAPHAASRLLDSYETALQSLRVNPGFYPLSAAATDLLGRRINRKSAGNYNLYYYVEEAQRKVIVFSFLHKRQDVAAHLRIDYLDSIE